MGHKREIFATTYVKSKEKRKKNTVYLVSFSCGSRSPVLALSLLSFVFASFLGCGLEHVLQDEDVIQIVKKTVTEERKDKSYGQKVQAYYDQWHEKKKKKPKLKS